MRVRICFVCLGNICRSPTAEATMRKLLEEEQLTAHVEIDSAGTGDWHVGEPPDHRARAAGERRGLDVRGRARRVTTEDFEYFDYVIAMDQSNRSDLHRLAHSHESKTKIDLLRNFDPDSPPDADVPDPYYGDGDGFERVIDICEAACRGLLRHIREKHSL
jgi:protein-tyrosine phosphatase